MDKEHKRRIGELYRQMYPVMLAYAGTVLNPALAEEAVQDTFLVACRRADALFSSPNPQGWLMNTLKNTIRSMQKERKEMTVMLGRYLLDRYGECCSAEEALPMSLLFGNMAGTEEFRLLYELVIVGKSHKELAEARGISLTACRKRVQRAKETLKKFFEKN